MRELLPCGFLAFLCCAPSAQAQLPTLDITSSVQNASELHVGIRSDDDFDGLFSSVVFTVRCDLGSGAIIGDALQDLPEIQYCSVFKSDVQQDEGAYTYQIFVGFGNSALSNFGASWFLGEEVLFCRIPISGANESCILVNDDWTEAHNGGFYVSLNGVDRTGVIYGTSTAVEEITSEQYGLSLIPNPAQDRARLLLRTEASVSSASLILIDAAGRKVGTENIRSNEGVFDRDLDLRGLAAGLYTLQVNVLDQQLFQRFVIE